MSAQHLGEVGRLRPMPVKEGVNIKDHSLVAKEGNLAVPATVANLTAGAEFIGVAHKGLDNTNGADGVIEGVPSLATAYPERYCIVDYTGVYSFFYNGTAELFAEIWVLNENGLHALAPAYNQRAGLVVGLLPGQHALVDFSQ